MLSIDIIRNNKQKVIDGAKNKNRKIDVDKILSLDDQRRDLIQQTQKLREERNVLVKQQVTDSVKERGKQIKEELKNLDLKLNETETELNKLLSFVPNVPLDDVPVGKDESGNVVIKKWGEPKKFNFTPKDHLEIGQMLDLIDVETAAKVSGTRFGYIKNELAILEYSLLLYVLKILTDQEILRQIADHVKKDWNPKPFIPVIPPVMIKPDVYRKMARLDETQEEERYYFPRDDIYLIGSAEHTLGPMHMDQVIPEQNLPIRYVGFSTSFRRESGTYGKDTRGILRVHQFDKMEMESFSAPEDSKTEQDFFVAIQEYIVQSLNIPYQVVMICTGDMGGPDARQIDIESWMPGQNKYRETHTSDLMTDYQARRLNTKLKRKNGQTEYVHMNDATAFAGRTLIAILENYQQEDGSVKIPEVLQPYTGFKEIKRK